MHQIGESDDKYVLQLKRVKLKATEIMKRREKLLNSKNRVIGIDKDILDSQVDENHRHRLEFYKAQELEDEKLRENIKKANHIAQKNFETSCRNYDNLAKFWDIQSQKYVYEKENFSSQEDEIDVAVNNPHTYNDYNISKNKDFLIEEDYNAIKLEKKRKQREQYRMLSQQKEEQEDQKLSELEQLKKFSEAQNDLLRNLNDTMERRANAKLLKALQIQQENLKLHDSQVMRENERQKDGVKRNLAHIQAQMKLSIVSEKPFNEDRTKIIRTEFKRWHPNQMKRMLTEREIQIQNRKEINEKYIEEENHRSLLNRKIYMHQDEIEVENKIKLKKKNQNVALVNRAKSISDCQKKSADREYYLKPGIARNWWPFGKNDR